MQLLMSSPAQFNISINVLNKLSPVEDCIHYKPIILSLISVSKTYLKTITHWSKPKTSVVVSIKTEYDLDSLTSVPNLTLLKFVLHS